MTFKAFIIYIYKRQVSRQAVPKVEIGPSTAVPIIQCILYLIFLLLFVFKENFTKFFQSFAHFLKAHISNLLSN